MVSNVYTRSLRARFGTFKESLDKTLELIAGNAAQGNRTNQADDLYRAGRDLLDMLDDSDRPDWLKTLTSAARKLANPDQNNSHAFLRCAVQHYPSVKPIEVSGGAQRYDFDALFKHMRENGRITELFDRMIEAVSQMIESGEIENIYVIQALTKLLDLLKANRDGSYLAVVTTFNYARFVQNYAGELLKRVPGVAEFATAYEKTIQEGEEELAKLQTDIQGEAIKLLLDEKSQAKLKTMTVERIAGPVTAAEPNDTLDAEFKRIE